ncbi:MAG TPA: hypothetical protein VNG69_17635 [Casimicrobiaceae bacterium]|nr:hypothetical protein [Casimicrobiaceae bacterium]
MRCLPGLALCAVLAGCTTQAIVYSPDDELDGPATGTVKPLRSILPEKDASIRLVMIHGVGDHCSGYALHPKEGWLNDKTIQHIRMQPLEPPRPAQRIFSNVFNKELKGAQDDRSYVEYAIREFALRLDNDEVPVQAIEVTWSHITQWIKSNYLGYDSPSVTPAPGDKTVGCIEAPDKNVKRIKSPPERLFLDRVIKEAVFDRRLSDAIIYAGSYGAVIERAVAEALCRAISARPNAKECIWPTQAEVASDRNAYLFVTHSLGSRIVFDTILHLGDYESARSNPFSEQEIKSAVPFIRHMLANTTAVYMMANQLSLIGLAHLPLNARSTEILKPLVVDPMAFGSQKDVVAGRRVKAPNEDGCDSVLTQFGHARMAARRALRLHSTKGDALQLIAFNDTNDLLTWHVPSWYAKRELKPDCEANVELVNVFVQNAAHLLIVEPPQSAHLDYFRNANVWEVIACGASNGKVVQCPK